MTDILIKGLALPKKGEVMKLYLCSDGDVGYDDDGKPYKTKAIELPPHGDLIDRQELLKLDNITYIDTGHWSTDYEAVKVAVIKKSPTIVEANDGSDN